MIYNQWILILKSNNRSNQLNALKDILHETIPFASTNEEELILTLASYIKELQCNEFCTDKLLLEFAYRAYYHVLIVTNKLDEHFFNKIDTFNPQKQSQILYFITSSDYCKLIPNEILRKQLFDVLNNVLTSNIQINGTVLKAINLFCKKFSSDDLKITLDIFYYCMQCNEIGVKDETKILFKYCIQSDYNLALEYFTIIVNFWPWTNKNKFYFLSLIIEQYNFEDILIACNLKISNFFHGVRMSLIYKNLYASGQYLVKTLFKQNILALDAMIVNMIVNILQTGSETEIINLNFQWLSHINNRDEIFRRLNYHEDILLESFKTNVQFILTIIMFGSAFLKNWKQNKYNELMSFLMEKYLNFSHDVRLLVLQFIVKNLSRLEIKSSLNFIIEFINEHIYLPSTRFRHSIMTQLPLVFNFLSIMLKKQKMTVTKQSNFSHCLKKFFLSLKDMFYTGITSTEYQPLIFGIKILEIIEKILYDDSVTLLKKKDLNCTLGGFLIKEGIFDIKTIQTQLINSIDELGSYDDVRDILINILISLKYHDIDSCCFTKYKELSNNSDINKNILCPFYVKIILQSCTPIKGHNICTQVFEYSFKEIKNVMVNFASDPLLICKSGKHLFGHLSAINEVFNKCPAQFKIHQKTIILELEIIANTVLKLLNTTGNDDEKVAASFQVIEENLALLVNKSAYKDTTQKNPNKKFLLISFWMSLKACCDLSSTLGIILTETSKEEDLDFKMLEKCLQLNVTVLHLCRHKGAFEAAGLSFGKLVKAISSKHQYNSRTYQLLFNCFSILFGSVNEISTTRRGAGLSIMFYRLIANDMNKSKPLFRHAIRILVNDHTQKVPPTTKVTMDEIQKYENFDALALHYLCCLVKATDLHFIVQHFDEIDEIMMSAMIHIENPEWTVRNAALQLFGSIVPKIVGQKQTNGCDNTDVGWEPTEITYVEFHKMLPKTCKHIQFYCNVLKNKCIAPGTVILFLEFLSRVEYLKKDYMDCQPLSMTNFHEIFWQFLYHPCEKIRKLAAICVVRAHDFRIELPRLLRGVISILFKVKSENFLQGLIFVLIEGLRKIKCDWKYVSVVSYDSFLKELQQTFQESYTFIKICYHTRCSLLEFLVLSGFDLNSQIAIEILVSKPYASKSDITNDYCHKACDFRIGYDEWKQKMLTYYK